MSKGHKITRKLKAILSADVKGYSLLMSDDEVLTLKTLDEYKNIMSELISSHSGRVVDSVGDNLLAEFSSAVDAVQCAIEIQKKLKKENSKFVERKRLQFRIGINIGDVIHDGDRIVGEGINIASRIEGIADAGGICISRNTFDQIEAKLDIQTKYLGEHQVKNIKKPVRVYKVLIGEDGYTPLVEEKLELPDKPSIAVLPFTNMSGDPSQEYFSDGLTEQIINGLCKVYNLFVIARNSSFAYKGKSVGVKQIAKELGVKYILEGSVQKAGNRVRITAQLIDATTDYHMWSETYDRNLEDIFALQDEITMNVITEMQVKLIHGEQAKRWTEGTNSLDAYMHTLKGYDYLHQENLEAIMLARQEAEKAISLDPNYISPYILLAGTYIVSFWWETGSVRDNSLNQLQMNLDKAFNIDKENSDAHICLGMLNLFKGDMEKALFYCRKATILSPNNSLAYLQYAYIQFWNGEHENALLTFGKAFQLDPFPSNIAYVQRGETYFVMERYNEAKNDFLKALSIQQYDIFAHLGLIATYQRLDENEKVKDQIKELFKIDSNFQLMSYGIHKGSGFFFNPLKEAGLPE